jgi:hypothetical protein
MNRSGRLLVVTIGASIAALVAASCGAPAKPASSPPMDGNASVRPSPARAERVPVGGPASPAASASASAS